MQYFAMIYLAVENLTDLQLRHTIGRGSLPDQSHTQYLGHSHLWIFQHVLQTRDIVTVQCQCS